MLYRELSGIRCRRRFAKLWTVGRNSLRVFRSGIGWPRSRRWFGWPGSCWFGTSCHTRVCNGVTNPASLITTHRALENMLQDCYLTWSEPERLRSGSEPRPPGPAAAGSFPEPSMFVDRAIRMRLKAWCAFAARGDARPPQQGRLDRLG